VNWTDPAHLQAAALCFVACGILGWFVPGLIARVPEPAPESASEPVVDPVTDVVADAVADPATSRRSALPPPPPKEPYAAIAALPGLAWRTALASALAGLLVGAGTGWTWSLLHLVPLVAIGVALALLDWRTTLLPTRIIAPAYALVVAMVLVAAVLEWDWHGLARAGMGWLVMGGVFLLLWLVYPAGMGYGDVRLSGVLGLALGHLGWQQLLVGSYAGFLIGGVGGAVLAVLKIVERKRFPFGPFMLLGALLGAAAGPAMMSGLGY
jgi:leader peptidase (prepilin peptidase)/N-methyltransferase